MGTITCTCLSKIRGWHVTSSGAENVAMVCVGLAALCSLRKSNHERRRGEEEEEQEKCVVRYFSVMGGM